MTTEEFNKSEAKFIANLILERLDFSDVEINSFVNIPEKYLEVIRSIEDIEKTRFLEISNQSHTFWRKEKNEKIWLWSVPKMSAMVMAELVSTTRSKIILEIGTSAWYSTLFLSAWALTTWWKVYTIELLKEKIDLAKNNFHKANTKNIELIEKEASKALLEWSRDEIDFVFLDADKENYGKYLDILLPKMKIWWIIVADNINDYWHMMENYLQRVSWTHLPKSRCDSRVKSTYIAQLDNWLMITKKIWNG